MPRLQQASKWFQYLYFLRFPILGWLMLPGLCLVDGCTGVSSITRGIMTLSWGAQAFYAAFFVSALMMAILICARNIVRNGRARFQSPPPPSLRRALTKSEPRRVWAVLAVTHVSSVITLGYVAWTTIQEQETAFGVQYWKLWSWYVLGLISSFIFWYLVSVFYLWTYPAQADRDPSALLFPGTMWGFRSAQRTAKPKVAVWIEAASRKVLGVTHVGYASSQEGPLWELHLLTTVALGGFLLLYLFLYPIIAPVVVSGGYLDASLAIALFIVFVLGACKVGGGMDQIGWLFLLIQAVCLTLFLCFLYFDNKVLHRVLMESAFPTLASVLVIIIFFLWLLSGVSFFLDRYRIPVLTIALLAVFVPKYLPVDQEHYFEATYTKRIDAVDTPKLAINHRIKNPEEPYIIVTASGGGIQAAEWTAQVMAQLEKRFRDDMDLKKKGGYLFHNHLILVSGVSGGSVGLMPYLLEYTGNPTFSNAGNDLLTQRLTKAPECSSLEAVAWGLEYYDLQRLLLTLRFSWLQSTDKGYAPDRTWALSQTFNRNLNDTNCHTDAAQFKGLPPVLSGEEMTLKTAAQRLQEGSMPAFTFNTTVAETGGRFLLSNYEVRPILIGPKTTTAPLQAENDFLPAESFLQAYTQESHCDIGQLKNACYADISLATAARLSATFPFVSSGTRLPKKYAKVASHFLDGGYYDNDGTASVTEFLYSAMYDRLHPDLAASEDPKPMPPKLKVLLIEIRDGDDLNPLENMDDWKHQNGFDLEKGATPPKPWGTASQIGAPLLGMWNAGHVSITRRNRRELCSLETAFALNLEVHHVVIGITAEPKKGKPDQYKAAPLSWKLTASQEQYIKDWAVQKDKPTQQAIDDAIQWISNQIPDKSKIGSHSAESISHSSDDPTCKVMDQTYMRR